MKVYGKQRLTAAMNFSKEFIEKYCIQIRLIYIKKKVIIWIVVPFGIHLTFFISETITDKSNHAGNIIRNLQKTSYRNWTSHKVKGNVGHTIYDSSK